MKRLILLFLLIGVGVYIYVVVYRNNNFFTNQLTNDEFIEKPIQHEQKKVHFSEKNEEFIIPNKEDVKQQQQEEELDSNLHFIEEPTKISPEFIKENLYDDIFIVNPMEINNTNLTLSENEYFNNM
jgi:hypothetical protein